MRAYELLTETSKNELYHVTHTKHVPSIQKNGLHQMGADSNWVQQGSGDRYGAGEIYMFTNKEDANRWAGRMDWDFNQTIGSGEISIITFSGLAGHEFEKDEGDPMGQAGAQGDWLKTLVPIPPQHIVKVETYNPKKLNEKASRGRPIICVDVQPEYSGMNDGDEDSTFEAAIRFVNDSRAPCLMFVNAEDQGLTGDTIEAIKMYWEDSGFEPENWGRIEVYDKGYGYLRSWMSIGIEDKYIIAVIREMYKQKVYDSRMLFDSDEDKILEYLQPVAESINTEAQYLVDDPLSVGWAAIDQLKRYNNSYLIGGGRQECLREVSLLMNAFNIKYKLIDNLIYGN